MIGVRPPALLLRAFHLSSRIGHFFIIGLTVGDHVILSRSRMKYLVLGGKLRSRSWFVLLLGFVGRKWWQYHRRLCNCNTLMSSGALLEVPARCADRKRTIEASVEDRFVMFSTFFALGRMCKDLSECPMCP